MFPLIGWLNKNKKKFFLTFLGLALIAGWIWSSQSKPTEVDIATAYEGEIIQYVSASGKIAASQAVNLTFQTSGKLAYVGVSEGDKIKKGKLVAALDKKQLEQTLRKYLNAFEKEFSNFEDSNDSIKDLVLTDSVRRIKNRAQIDLNQAVLDVEIQNEAIRLANLYSPIDGIVITANPKHAGVNVTPGNAIFEIVNPQTVYFEAKVNETDISQIQEGLPVELKLDAYPDEILSQKVNSISFSSTTTSTGATAYIVKVSLPPNENLKYRLGMNGDIKIITAQKKDVILAPQTALVETENKKYIWIIENGLSKKVEVETGIFSTNEIEIIKGLRKGDQIINRPPSDLKENAKVIQKRKK
ncbi:MAG: efflux RND transporter periplasmic adaptor subunit [Patescibacteria group bacterium]|nr:efflux RND transporter periplasmic adaptor subunit [Patescibacteria group bacterium]